MATKQTPGRAGAAQREALRVASRRDPDDVVTARTGMIDDGRMLRDVSDRLLAEVETIRSLEISTRDMAIGSREFEAVSREINDHIRAVFSMGAEQEALGVEARVQHRRIDDVPPTA